MTLLEHVGQLLVQNFPIQQLHIFASVCRRTRPRIWWIAAWVWYLWCNPFFVPQSRRKPETQTLVIQDLFPFSMCKSLEKRCFYGLIITFGHWILWNFPFLHSTPWNKDRILQLIGKFNSTARVDSHVVFFLWRTGVSLIPRGFIKQLLFFFLWRVISKCPPQLNDFLGSPQHTIYLKKQWVLCLPSLLPFVNFSTGKFGSSLKTIPNFEGNDEAPIAWLLEAWSGQTIAVETVWDETLWFSDWDFYHFLTVILSLDMARPARVLLFMFFCCWFKLAAINASILPAFPVLRIEFLLPLLFPLRLETGRCRVSGQNMTRGWYSESFAGHECYKKKKVRAKQGGRRKVTATVYALPLWINRNLQFASSRLYCRHL